MPDVRNRAERSGCTLRSSRPLLPPSPSRPGRHHRGDQYDRPFDRAARRARSDSSVPLIAHAITETNARLGNTRQRPATSSTRRDSNLAKNLIRGRAGPRSCAPAAYFSTPAENARAFFAAKRPRAARCAAARSRPSVRPRRGRRAVAAGSTANHLAFDAALTSSWQSSLWVACPWPAEARPRSRSATTIGLAERRRRRLRGLTSTGSTPTPRVGLGTRPTPCA